MVWSGRFVGFILPVFRNSDKGGRYTARNEIISPAADRTVRGFSRASKQASKLGLRYAICCTHYTYPSQERTDERKETSDEVVQLAEISRSRL